MTSSPSLMTLGPLLLPAVVGKGLEEHLTPTHITAWQTNGGASSPMLTPWGLAHLSPCYQSQLYYVFQGEEMQGLLC